VATPVPAPSSALSVTVTGDAVCQPPAPAAGAAARLDSGAVSSSEKSHTRNQSKRAKPAALFSPRKVPRPSCSGIADVSTVNEVMNSVQAMPSSE
jgi:hypothetical protein